MGFKSPKETPMTFQDAPGDTSFSRIFQEFQGAYEPWPNAALRPTI
jgi:hypothetical protein